MSASRNMALRCANCKEIFRRASARGRIPAFCSRRCRLASHRLRAKSAPPDISRDFDALLVQTTGHVLRQLQKVRKTAKDWDPQRHGSAAVLEEAIALQKEVESLVGLAVLQARGRRVRWTQIAAMTGVGPNRARTEWETQRVLRTVARRREVRLAAKARARERQTESHTPATTPAAEKERSPEKQFSMALSYLLRASGRSMRSLAAQVGVSPSYVARAVNGERIPAWEVVADLVRACGGEPSEVQPLWDEIHGRRPARPVFPHQEGAVDQAATDLRHAIRGLYLASSCPDPDDVAERLPELTGEQVAQLVRDDAPLVPEWPVVAQVVTALQGRPNAILPLWERVQVAAEPRWSPPPRTAN